MTVTIITIVIVNDNKKNIIYTHMICYFDHCTPHVSEVAGCGRKEQRTGRSGSGWSLKAGNHGRNFAVFTLSMDIKRCEKH